MSDSHTSAAQRRHVRKEFAAGQLLIADLIPADPSHKLKKQLGIILNLSEGGMAVQPFHALSPGWVADLRFDLPDVSATSAGRGQVAWRSEGGRVGLRFLDGQLADNDRLRVWLSRHSPDPKDDSELTLSALAGESGSCEFDTALRLLAYSAMVSTGASGAAIALGDSRRMECRASVGNAPDVGVPLRLGAGLSGLCLRTGRIILSHDVRTDPRVDSTVAEQLELRSLVILPIVVATRAAGLLEVFSKQPQAFDQRHLDQLQFLAGVLRQAIQEKNGDQNHKSNATTLAKHEDARAASVSVAAPQVTEPEARVKSDDLSDSQSLAATAPAMAAPAEVFANSVGEIRESIESEEEASPKTSHGSLGRTLFLGAAIVVAVLLVFALWPTLRTLTLRPQNSVGHSVPQSAPSQLPLGTSVSFDPIEIVQKVGATFTVNVMIRDAKNASVLPLQIFYDPAKLHLLSVSGGDMLARDGQKITFVHKEDATPGSIQVAATCPPASPGISGDGALVTLAFRSTASGRTRLRVNQAELRDPSSHLTLVNGTEALVIVSPSPVNAGNKPAEKNPTAKELRTEPATADSSVAPIAPLAAPLSTESKPAPEASSKTPSNEPESPAAQAGSLLIAGVPPGSNVWLDRQVYTAEAQDGKVAFRNLPPGEHHLRILLNGFQYHDELVDVKPGQIIKIEAHTFSH